MRYRLLIFISTFLRINNFPVTLSSLITDVLLKNDKLLPVTELSCNYKDSFSLLKEMNKHKGPLRVLFINDRLESHLSHKNLIFVMDFNCANSTSVLKMANKLNLFSFPYKWIISHKDPVTDMIKNFRKMNVLIDSDVNLLQHTDNSTAVLRKIYKYRTNYEIQIETVGYWNKNDSFIDLKLKRKRTDLNLTTLNTCIVITNNDSLNHLTDKRDKHIDPIAKVNYVLVEHLANIVNAKLNYSIQPTWGYKNNNSEWNGMIGFLIRNEADIGGTPLFLTIDRIDYIDYIAMTTPTRSCFIFREPKLSYVTNVYTLPFNRLVWLSIIGMVIITGLVLFFIMKWEFKKQRVMSIGIDHKSTILDVALLSFGALCQQASDSVPSSVPGRITTIILFLSLMFLYTSYSANIVALLQSSSSSIQTLEDLLKSRLDVGVDDNVFNRFYFPHSEEPIRKAIYQQKVAPPGNPPHFMPLLDGVKKIREGLFAFHMETGPGYKLIGEIFHESEKCGLKQIQYLEVVDPWIAIQKNSSYKKLLKVGLRKIQESGIQTREVGLIYTKKPECLSRGSTFISVGIVDCYPAVVVLAAGVIIAVFIWIMEVIVAGR